MYYELMLVAKVEGAESLMSLCEKNVKEASSDVRVTKLGRKNLAYPISGQSEAEYYVLNFSAQGDAIRNITSKLRLEQETLLRYLIIRTKESQAKVADSKKVTVKTVAKPKKEIPAKEKKEEKKSISAKGQLREAGESRSNELKVTKVVKSKTKSKSKK